MILLRCFFLFLGILLGTFSFSIRFFFFQLLTSAFPLCGRLWTGRRRQPRFTLFMVSPEQGLQLTQSRTVSTPWIYGIGTWLTLRGNWRCPGQILIGWCFLNVHINSHFLYDSNRSVIALSAGRPLLPVLLQKKSSSHQPFEGIARAQR